MILKISLVIAIIGNVYFAYKANPDSSARDWRPFYIISAILAATLLLNCPAWISLIVMFAAVLSI